MNKRINIYYFGEIGVYNEYCPEYVCDKNFVGEILYLISKDGPFTISKEEIIKTLNINLSTFEDIIEELKRINLIDIKDKYYKVNFPVFLEKDLEILDDTLGNIGRSIGDMIIKNKEYIYNKLTLLSSYNFFTKERLLYHIICDDIFDGTALEYFGQKGLFCVSKPQPDDRNYIVIGYEDNEVVESYSNKLLCSSNNYRSNGFTFNSFGDSNGERKDMYRFFRMTQKSLEDSTRSQNLNLAYIKIIDNKNKEVAEQCGKLILKISDSQISYTNLTETEKELADFLKKLNYISFDKNTDIISINVPIFIQSDRKIINELSTFILDGIFEKVKELFRDFEKDAKDITAIQHKVNIKEILNELWHQVFGLTNEYLVDKGFVEAPKHLNLEGRYFQSLIIN